MLGKPNLFSEVFPPRVPRSEEEHCLEGCAEKVRRARHNIEVLDADIGRFLTTEPYPNRAILDDSWFKSRGYIMHAMATGDNPRRIRLVVLREPPDAEWSVLIGEIVHDFRSALDQLVWGLSVSKSGPAPHDPIPKPWRDVGFPVVLDSAHWPGRSEKMLWAIKPPRLRASFRALQPFYRRKYPERHPLAVLHELWNRDKHRSLHFLSTLGGIDQLLPQRPDFFGGEGEFGVQLVQRRVVGPLEHGAYLGSVRFGGPWHGDEQGYVDMHLQFMFNVAFDNGPPAYGGLVIPTLQRVDQAVSMILAKYEPHLR